MEIIPVVGGLGLGFLGLGNLLLIGPALTCLGYLLFYETSNEILGARGVDLSARGGVDLGVFDDIWGQGTWGECCGDLDIWPTWPGPAGLLGRLPETSSGDSHGTDGWSGMEGKLLNYTPECQFLTVLYPYARFIPLRDIMRGIIRQLSTASRYN